MTKEEVRVDRSIWSLHAIVGQSNVQEGDREVDDGFHVTPEEAVVGAFDEVKLAGDARGLECLVIRNALLVWHELIERAVNEQCGRRRLGDVSDRARFAGDVGALRYRRSDKQRGR